MKHILDLIEKSPYKERCNKELKLDKDTTFKTIVASLSLDSGLLISNCKTFS